MFYILNNQKERQPFKEGGDIVDAMQAARQLHKIHGGPFKVFQERPQGDVLMGAVNCASSVTRSSEPRQVTVPSPRKKK